MKRKTTWKRKSSQRIIKAERSPDCIISNQNVIGITYLNGIFSSSFLIIYSILIYYGFSAKVMKTVYYRANDDAWNKRYNGSVQSYSGPQKKEKCIGIRCMEMRQRYVELKVHTLLFAYILFKLYRIFEWFINDWCNRRCPICELFALHCDLFSLFHINWYNLYGSKWSNMWSWYI